MPGADFEAAVKQSRELKAKPTDDELLQLYAYYKQVMQDPSFDKAEAPGTFDFKGKAKHRAWKKIVDENVTPAEAEKKYVALVEELKGKYGTA